MNQKTIKIFENPDLRNELIEKTNGDILKCFSCGTCTASCPVMRIDSKYNPRKIMRMALLGVDVLNEGFIWLCSTCYTCYERCPQGVRVTEVMNVLKNMAVEKGHIPMSFKKQVELLESHGRLYEISDFDNKKRARSELPEIHEDNKKIKNIFKISKLNEFKLIDDE